MSNYLLVAGWAALATAQAMSGDWLWAATSCGLCMYQTALATKGDK